MSSNIKYLNPSNIMVRSVLSDENPFFAFSIIQTLASVSRTLRSSTKCLPRYDLHREKRQVDHSHRIIYDRHHVPIHNNCGVLFSALVTLRFVMFQAPMPERDAQAVRLCTDVKYDDLLRGFRRGKARDSHYRDAISRLKYKKMWLMSW